MGCFEDVESEDDQVDEAALFPAPNNLLWKKKELKVFIMNYPLQEYNKDRINKEQIIGWMNEWSPGESPVPKFVRTEEIDHSDIRIKFTGQPPPPNPPLEGAVHGT